MNEDDSRFYKIIGKKIRQLRTEREMTLLELATKLGFTVKTVQRYETGERRLDVIKLKNLIEILGYNYDDFMREVQHEQITGMPANLNNIEKKDNYKINEPYLKFAKKLQDENISIEDLEKIYELFKSFSQKADEVISRSSKKEE